MELKADAANSMPKASLEQILATIPPQSRLMLDQKVSDNHLHEIAKSLINWRSVCSKLGISESDEEAIGNIRGTDEQRRALLRKWRSMYGPTATYKNLANCFYSADMLQMVEIVCEALGAPSSSIVIPPEARPVPMSSTSSNSQKLQPVLKHENTNANNGSNAELANVLENQSSFQQLSTSEKEVVKAMLDEDARDMKIQFGCLVTKTRDSVEERIPVQKFAGSILELGAYDPAPEGRDPSLLDEHREEIIRAESIVKIFIILSAYWNYLTYEVLEYIIKLYGTDEDKKRLRSYDEELQKYCKRRIFELPLPPSGSGNGTGNASSQGQNKFNVKLNVHKDTTCKDVLRIRRRIAKILHVNMAALIIVRVDTGCVQLTFLIPKFIAQEIFPLSNEQTSALSKDASVIRLECGEYVFENTEGQIDTPHTEDQIDTPSEAHAEDQINMPSETHAEDQIDMPSETHDTPHAEDQIDTPSETRTEDRIDSPRAEDQINTHSEAHAEDQIDTPSETQTKDQIDTHSETRTKDQINVHSETRAEDQIDMPSETRTEDQIDTPSETHDTPRAEDQIDTPSETHNEDQINTPSETRADDQIDTPSETHAEDQINTHSETHAEDQIDTPSETRTEDQIDTPSETCTEDQIDTPSETCTVDQSDMTLKQEGPENSAAFAQGLSKVAISAHENQQSTKAKIATFQEQNYAQQEEASPSVEVKGGEEPHSSQFGGYDTNFVEKIPNAFRTECPICCLILCDPYEAKCCGTNFCNSCGQHAQAADNRCPICKDDNFTMLQNKSLKRALSELQVFCTHRKVGCKWTGELGDLERHLNKVVHSGTHGEEGRVVRWARTGDRMGGRKGGGGRGGGECVSTKLLAIAGAVALMAVMTVYYTKPPPIPYTKPPPIPCAKLHVENGQVFLNKTEKEGIVQATIFCNEGFILEGKDTLNCTKSGKWDGEVPKCISIDCGPPPQIQDGTVTCSGTASDAMAEYKCKKGFLLDGPSTMVCNSDGQTAKWSSLDDTNSAPVCKSMKCPVLEKPMNGRVEAKERTLDSTAEYECNDGFILAGGDRVRKCLAGGSWSAKAPLCEFGGEDKVAYSIQRKTNRLQEIAWSLKGQNNIAQALEDISSNLATSKLQAGMVGLMKSGKSSVLNALMKSETLPVAIQAETAVEVRIIHSTQYEHRNGVLFGENDDHSYEVIAESSDNIKGRLREFNKIARNESTGEESTGEALPHKSFVLRTLFPFLRDFKMKHTLQISDTAGPNEAGAVDATAKSKEAMKRLSALIIVLNYRALKDQGKIHLLTHLRDHHSHLLETKGRFLFVVNQIDAYHEEAHGDKYSIPPQDVPRYVQKYLKDNLGVEVPIGFIVPFSAKWALKSHMWSKNLASMSDVEYFSAMQLSCKSQGMDPPAGLRVPNEHNKIVVLNGLKLFSKIGELEAKLHQMLGNYGPEILYKGAIDDAVLHVSALTVHIEEEKVKCNIGATQTDLQLHKDVKEEVDTAVAANKERRPKIPLEVDRNITTRVIELTNELTYSIYDKMLSLKLNEQSVEMVLLTLKEHTLKEQILETAENKMEKHWPQIMGTTLGIVKEETNAMLSAFKRDLEERVSRFDGIELKLDKIDLAKLEPRSPPFTLVLSVSPNKSLKNTTDVLWDLAVDLAVQFQERVKTEATKLSFATAGQTERAAQQSVSKFRQKIQKEILRLTDELESKQGFIESLNQKLNELQTISGQLKGARDKIEMSLLDEIE